MDQKIIDKIKKLLTLANDKREEGGASEGEIMNAMRKAKELAMRHDLDLAGINLDDDTGPTGGIVIITDKELKTKSKYEQPYHRYIVRAVSDIFGVGIIKYFSRDFYSGRERVHHYAILGEATDVAMSKEIFKYLEKLFPKSLTEMVNLGHFTYSAFDSRGWYSGLTEGIVQANKRIEEEVLKEEEKEQYAMVLVKKEDLITRKLKEEFPHLVYDTPKHDSNPTAYMAGRAKGSQINLRQIK